MPFQRISVVSGKDVAYRQAIADGVHRALVETCAVPQDDRFQIITEHPSGGLVCTPSYLGIAHGRAPVFVQIAMRVADLLLESPARVPRSDVIISLVEVEKEDWSFGDGRAQYAAEESKEPA
jgi:4-oxalocrotonate tautomerase